MAWPKGVSRKEKRYAADIKRANNSRQYDEGIQESKEGQTGLLRDGECREIERSPSVSAEVRDPHFAGVSTEHPSIVTSIQNMTRQGKSKEEICRVVGMPMEVVERHQRDVKR